MTIVDTAPAPVAELPSGLNTPRRRVRRRRTRTLFTYACLVAFIAAGAWAVLDARRYTPAFALAYESLTHDADLLERLGAPLEAGSVFGGFNVSAAGQEEASLSFTLRGPRAEATAYVSANEVGSIWSIARLEVELSSSRERLVLVETHAADAHPDAQASALLPQSSTLPRTAQD